MEKSQLYQLFLQSKGVITDTRKIEPGHLFFALKGENFNGNQFAKLALEKGAIAAVVDEKEFEGNNIFLVDNVLESLQKLANEHRKNLNLLIIALTGSNGKTTTKELIFHVLKTNFNAKATVGNLNNHIGVPLTLLSFDDKTEFGIVELGANHQKEIELLCKIAQPDFGYITNFGKAHLEGFGGVEGVIKGKSEMYDFLRLNDKKVIVNADDSTQMEKSDGIERITFSTKNKADFHFESIMNDNFIGLKFKNQEIFSNLIGAYNFPNLAAAVTIGLHFGIEFSNIKSAIENYFPTNNRSQILQKNNFEILLDAYNANPSSMTAALNNFAGLSDSKTVILGDMFELGNESKTEHQNIADLAESLKFDNIILVGIAFSGTNSAKTNTKKFTEKAELIEYLKQNPISTKRILIKGSRGMALETILDYL